jgi:hypothetical protein
VPGVMSIGVDDADGTRRSATKPATPRLGARFSLTR